VRNTYALALPVYVPTLLLSIGSGVLVPTLPLYADSFGVSLSLVAIAVAAEGLGTLIGDVPAGSLAIARGRQVIKPDWAAKRKTARKPDKKGGH